MMITKQISLTIIILLANTLTLLPQVNLTIEGTNIVNTVTGEWLGVNIQRDVPTKLIYRNNSITSRNSRGYLLQAGDESPLSTNNNLDGEVITGNKLVWNGTYGSSIITHGLFAGYNINSVVKYNYLLDVPYGIIFKSGTDNGVNMTFTAGGCAYNIWKNGKFAGRVKGVNGVRFYNNTFYSGDGKGWYLLFMTENMDRAKPAPSTGTKVFNNIFYSVTRIPMIKIESASLSGFECDYNLYWCTAGEPVFNIDGTDVTWTQWKARGYDAHSVIMDPRFNNTDDLVPSSRLEYGKDLGAEWKTGLSATAVWIPGTSPAMANQGTVWQVGARILAPADTTSGNESSSIDFYRDANDGLYWIKLTGTHTEPSYRVSVLDTVGRKVYGSTIQTSTQLHQLDLRHLAKAVYVVLIEGGSTRFREKFLRI